MDPDLREKKSEFGADVTIDGVGEDLRFYADHAPDVLEGDLKIVWIGSDRIALD